MCSAMWWNDKSKKEEHLNIELYRPFFRFKSLCLLIWFLSAVYANLHLVSSMWAKTQSTNRTMMKKIIRSKKINNKWRWAWLLTCLFWPKARSSNEHASGGLVDCSDLLTDWLHHNNNIWIWNPQLACGKLDVAADDNGDRLTTWFEIWKSLTQTPTRTPVTQLWCQLSC